MTTSCLRTSLCDIAVRAARHSAPPLRCAREGLAGVRTGSALACWRAARPRTFLADAASARTKQDCSSLHLSQVRACTRACRVALRRRLRAHTSASSLVSAVRACMSASAARAAGWRLHARSPASLDDPSASPPSRRAMQSTLPLQGVASLHWSSRAAVFPLVDLMQPYTRLTPKHTWRQVQVPRCRLRRSRRRRRHLVGRRYQRQV